MRELLTRWAELEPATCRSVENDYFKISLDDSSWHIVYPDNLSCQDLMWIQWAVQEAIVSREWSFEMYYTPAGGYGSVVIVPSKQRVRIYSDNNMAEALLSAYVKALESEVKSDDR